MFLTGTSPSAADPYYPSFASVPVGKSIVIPIAISGSGPIAYTVTSSSPGIATIVKTGYPVMNIHVTFSGSTGTLSTAYPFTGGTDGGAPYAGLVTGTAGTLYGTTETDGSSGFGTVYQITTGGSFNSIYSFTGGADGGNPFSGVITGFGGFLYGTTGTGGSGFGTVYQLSSTGSFATLHSFIGTDGATPYGGLVTGTDGNLYGATESGGTYGHGTIYQSSTTGSFNSLYSFTGGNDGGSPQSTLDSAPNTFLYGTTVTGGSSGNGTIFTVTTTGSLATVHSFSGSTDGASPFGGLITGTDGIFYGATETSGSGNFGTLYQLTQSGTFTTLHSFTGGSDGGNPYAPPVQASDGNFYGATSTGGADNLGTIYQFTSTGSFSTIYSFTGGNDGGNPVGALDEGVTGTLFGTAKTGGADGHGVIFEIPLPNSGAFSGTMRFALLRDMAPSTAGYIAGFAQSGYYNGLDFFRNTNLDASTGGSGFIAQGGDPSNTGTGNPGFTIKNEFNPSLIFDGVGQLAMANSGINTSTFQPSNGAQFFFTGAPIRSLDFGYTLFGQLITGFDILQDVLGVPLKATSDGSTPSAPVTPVIMDNVTVSEDNTDAILLVSGAASVPNGATIKVKAVDLSGTQAVSLSGTTTTPGLSFSIATADDTVDDPPYVESVADYNIPIHQKLTFPVRTVDLEFDYLIANAVSLQEFSPAAVGFNNNIATVTPSAFDPVSSEPVGLDVYQPFSSVERSSPFDVTPLNVGFGMGVFTPLPALLTGSAGTPVVSHMIVSGKAVVSGSNVGSFITSDPQNVPADFAATINWGDGALTSGSSNVLVATSPGYPTGFNIIAPAGHTYTNPGIYPVNVTVTASNGGTFEIQNTAVSGSSMLSGSTAFPNPIYADGRSFTAARGLADGLIATFIDYSPNVSPADYSATIDWGDGVIAQGTVRGANGNFQVYGRHQYTGGTTYPVDVNVSSLIEPGESSDAWSTARLTGIGSRQPPFAQSHVNGQIGNPGFNGDFLSEQVTLFNSGNLPSGPVALRFYLSPDSNTQPINSSAIPLAVAGRSTYNTPSIGAGAAIQGAVSEITLPSNAVSRGKWIIMQIITSDPIGNHMDYPRAVADPFPLIE